MNDPLELQQLFEEYERCVEGEPGTFGEGLREFAPTAPRSEATWPFVASFSSEPDSLPMWLAYTGNRSGVAIEVDVTSLRSLQVEDHGLSLTKVTYGSAELARVVAGLVDPVRSSWMATERHHPAGGSEGQHQQVKAIPDHLLTRASAYKPTGWAYEHEWRLVASYVGGTGSTWDVQDWDREAAWHYRDSGQRYVVARFDPQRLIRGVQVGPCGDLGAVTQALQQGGVAVQPTRSGIAVRCF